MNETITNVRSVTAQVPQEALAFNRHRLEEAQTHAERGPDGSEPRTDCNENSFPVAATMTGMDEPPNEATSTPTLTRREALRYYERIVEQSIAREDQKVRALLIIHDERLYTLTHASFGDYLKQRWKLSRSRGYQLLHLGRLKTRPPLNGEPPPRNERQARQFAADGTRLKEVGQNAHERRLELVTRYLSAHLAKMPPEENRRFLLEMRKMLDRLEQNLEIQSPSDSQDLAFVKTELRGCSSGTGVNLPQMEAPVSTSSPVLETQEVQAIPEVTCEGEPPLSLTTGASTSSKRPYPQGQAGSFLGLTMEQARKFGYCPK